MEKLVTILSSLLFVLGVKAQVQVKKETSPQVKPPPAPFDSATVKPIKDMHIKQTITSFKHGNTADSLKQKGPDGGIKQSVPVKQTVPIKDDKVIKFDKNPLPVKETPVKQ